MEELEITVDKTQIPISSFIDYAGIDKFFAVSKNNNLYYQTKTSQPNEIYGLLKENYDNERHND